MTELFDIYDEDLNHIGVKPREVVHRHGDWHQVFHCWVIGKDDEGTEFMIMQKRGPNQDTFPNKLDIGAAGHLQAGETVEDGARELEEELGLVVDFDDLISLGVRVGIVKYKDLIDCQICHVFFCECHQPLRDYQYQKEEITGLVKVPLDDGTRLLAGEIDSLVVEAIDLGQEEIRITTEDFISSVDHYGLKAFILAKSYFDGEQYLLI